MFTRTAISAFLAIALPTFSFAASEAEMTELISAKPYSVKWMKDGEDITSKGPVRGIAYTRDGKATIKLTNGQSIPSTWKFIDDGKGLQLVIPSAGTYTYDLLEVTAEVFRKRNRENGVEIVQTPAQ
jgi:hypothetical protein